MHRITFAEVNMRVCVKNIEHVCGGVYTTRVCTCVLAGVGIGDNFEF